MFNNIHGKLPYYWSLWEIWISVRNVHICCCRKPNIQKLSHPLLRISMDLLDGLSVLSTNVNKMLHKKEKSTEASARSVNRVRWSVVQIDGTLRWSDWECAEYISNSIFHSCQNHIFRPDTESQRIEYTAKRRIILRLWCGTECAQNKTSKTHHRITLIITFVYSTTISCRSLSKKSSWQLVSLDVFQFILFSFCCDRQVFSISLIVATIHIV